MVDNNFRKYFVDNAIDGWQNINKNDLANLCIEHEDQPDYNKYLSALICKYLYKNTTLKGRFGNYLNDEELDDRIVDGVLRALKYRSWLRPETNVYGDPDGPDKTINQCIKSQCQVYKRLNFGTEGKNPAYKKRIKYFTDSLDSYQEDYGDYSYNLFVTKDDESKSLDSLIKTYIRNNSMIEALILDTICYQDSTRDRFETKTLLDENGEEEEIKIPHYVFDKRKVIKNISEMNHNYMEYFSSKYTVDINELYNINDLIQKNTKSNNNFLYRRLEKLLNSFRDNPTLLRSMM